MSDHKAEPDSKTITLNRGRRGWAGTRWSHCAICGKRISETVTGWRHRK